MRKIIDYFGGEKRFYIIMVVLILMWAGVMVLFYLKADEVTKNPCSICAKKMDQNVICSIGNHGQIIQRTFYQDFGIVDKVQGQEVLPP